MLLWEFLTAPIQNGTTQNTGLRAVVLRTQRLPYENRCAAITKSGRRCRGRIRRGSDWCVFHDPDLAAQRRSMSSSSRKRGTRRLTHLPDGYLRKLSNRRSVGGAMDRLYREVRLGVVTPEMGNVLFGILTRILDSGLISETPTPRSIDRSKAGRIRPKLGALLTRAERAAWQRAWANAPEKVLRGIREPASLSVGNSQVVPVQQLEAGDKSCALTLQAAS